MPDAALEWLSPTFNRMYVCARVGRALVPPARLLKASLLIALYSVRSERAFCEELEYNLLYRWFLDIDLMERSFDATVFTKNRQGLLAHDAGRVLFDEVVWAADEEELLSDKHFSVDGTLIEAAASLTGFRSKEGTLTQRDPGQHHRSRSTPAAQGEGQTQSRGAGVNRGDEEPIRDIGRAPWARSKFTAD